MKVAIQGELGSFSHEAAKRMLPDWQVVPCARSLQVFDRLQRRSVKAAIIPIENSLAGSVIEHLDLLFARNVFIQREFRLRIVHNLIAGRKTRLQDIRKVYSHPVALDQCRDFFRRNPKLEPVPFYDTAGSVKHVIENGLTDAAGIASRNAAGVYGGKILRAGIEDDKQNYTRFFLISTKKKIEAGANKTSLAFCLKNVPGSLFQALSVFAARGISLSKIESRPIRGRPWEYVFYADILEGDNPETRLALRQLRTMADSVKVLGVYRAA
jgi:prephenate dehydratase